MKTMKTRTSPFGMPLLLATLLTAAPAAGQDLSELFQSVSGAVVIVHTSSTEYPFLTTEAPLAVPGTGSGVLVSPTEIMTASHVVQAAGEILVEFPSGERIRALVTASSPGQDVALLQLVAPTTAQPLPLGDSDAMAVGDRVFVVGAPFGQGHTLTVGYVSARRRSDDLLGGTTSVEFIQTDAAINPGNSGGPMFNMQGEVVGIVSHILTLTGGFQGMGYAVAANTARQVLLEERTLWTGLEGVSLTGPLAALLNVPPPGGGILVQKVASGSAAEALGLRPGTIPSSIAGKELLLGGDILLAFEGIPVGSALEGIGEMRRVAASLPPGSAVTVTVLRAGRTIELTEVLPY